MYHHGRDSNSSASSSEVEDSARTRLCGALPGAANWPGRRLVGQIPRSFAGTIGNPPNLENQCHSLRKYPSGNIERSYLIKVSKVTHTHGTLVQPKKARSFTLWAPGSLWIGGACRACTIKA